MQSFLGLPQLPDFISEVDAVTHTWFSQGRLGKQVSDVSISREKGVFCLSLTQDKTIQTWDRVSDIEQMKEQMNRWLPFNKPEEAEIDLFPSSVSSRETRSHRARRQIWHRCWRSLRHFDDGLFPGSHVELQHFDVSPVSVSCQVTPSLHLG